MPPAPHAPAATLPRRSPRPAFPRAAISRFLARFVPGLALLPLVACAALPPAPQSASAPVHASSAAAPVAGGKAGPGAGVAAANDPRVGAIGEAILKQGGSATDAAVAMMFALTVVEPQSTGLGGGGFLVTGDANGVVATFDGRESAPAAAGPDWFLGPDGKPREREAAQLSGLSSGVPGNVALAAKAWQANGRLPWADLLAPAIGLASDGFAITPRLSGSLATFPQRAARKAAGKALFYRPDGTAPPAGTVIRLPELAADLRMIASKGASSFYSGDFASGMAARIDADMPRDRSQAGAITAADIADYRAKERPPACLAYRLYRVCTMGPPSSGGYAVLAILKQIERFDIGKLGEKNPVTWHLFLEAQRLAYADRARYIADPDFVKVPMAGLLDPKYLAARSALISPGTTMPQAEAGKPAGADLALADGVRWPEHGTTHFVAVDAAGDMASFTSTVEAAFGSGNVYHGFYLNNELTDFAFQPVGAGGPVANRVEGGKRPASSMSPVVIYDPQGRPFMTVGAAGGGLIPVETAHAIVGVIDFHLPLEQALALPFVMDVGDDTVLVEKGTWMEALGPQLLALGHRKVVPFDQLIRTTAALRGADGWKAAFDPRLIPLVTIPATPGTAASSEAGYSEGQGTHP